MFSEFMFQIPNFMYLIISSPTQVTLLYQNMSGNILCVFFLKFNVFVTILYSIKTAIFRDILTEWDIGGQLKLTNLY